MYKHAWLSYKLQNDQLKDLPENILYLSLGSIFNIEIPVLPIKFDFTKLLDIIKKEQNNGGLRLTHISEHTLYKFQNYILENFSVYSLRNRTNIKDFYLLWKKIYETYEKNTVTSCYPYLFALQLQYNEIVPIHRYTSYPDQNINFIPYQLKDMLVTSAIKYLINI